MMRCSSSPGWTTHEAVGAPCLFLSFIVVITILKVLMLFTLWRAELQKLQNDCRSVLALSEQQERMFRQQQQQQERLGMGALKGPKVARGPQSQPQVSQACTYSRLQASDLKPFPAASRAVRQLECGCQPF